MAQTDASETIRALEERACNAWPAHQTLLIGGWSVRLGRGYTKRANSASALWPDGSFEQVRGVIEAIYQRQGLKPVFRLSPLAGDADAVLADAGYRMIEPVSIMRCALDAPNEDSQGVVVHAQASQAWLGGFAAATGLSASARSRHEAMLSALALPAGHATLYHDAQAVAHGLAVLERGMVGLFDIVVAPAHRGRGFGRALTRGLLAWGRAQGASQAYLQVAIANTVAANLYRRLGFEPVYQYHYRVHD